MIKGIRNTLVLTMFMFLGLCMAFIIYTNPKDFDVVAKMDKVQLNEEELISFSKLVNENDLLREPSLVNSEITNEDLLKFILSNLSEEDIFYRTGSFNGFICSMDYVDFSYSDGCRFMGVTNKTIMDYQIKYFNTNRSLNFVDIEYKGLQCKNNGYGYYCLMKPYALDIRKYSIVDSVYMSDNRYIVRDYYVNINMNDVNECNKYFNESFCANYTTEKEPEINIDSVKEYGALFEYMFVRDGENYYLTSYHILR